jgi:hypothetical protein
VGSAAGGATYKGKGGAAAAARIAEWKALFASYCEQAQLELSLPSKLNITRSEDQLREAIAVTKASLGVTAPAMIGDMRLMEVLVARGAAIDQPVTVDLYDWAPRDSTPLLVVCLDIAGHDAEHTEYPGNPTVEFLRMLGNELDKGADAPCSSFASGPTSPERSTCATPPTLRRRARTVPPDLTA